MRLLSSVISRFPECIFVPLYKISPLTRNSGTRSFILFRHLINVLLPHPEGPIMAVTDFGGISKFTFFNACFSPYQALTSFILKAIYVLLHSPSYLFRILMSDPDCDCIHHKCYYQKDYYTSRGVSKKALLRP